MITLFFVGIAEMIIGTLWTKLVSESKIMASGMITMVNIFAWYYVLQAVIGDLGNWLLVFMYALGCALGVVLTTTFFKFYEKFKKRKKAELRKAAKQGLAVPTFGKRVIHSYEPND